MGQAPKEWPFQKDPVGWTVPGGHSTLGPMSQSVPVNPKVDTGPINTLTPLKEREILGNKSHSDRTRWGTSSTTLIHL